MILNLSEISLSFGDNEILNNISFLINEGEKVALIGDNGCGKSTLLKIICKEYTPDNGTVVTKKDSTLGYVKQHQNFESTKTLYEVLLESKQNLIDFEERLRQMENDMAKLEGKALEDHINKYQIETRKFEDLGGYTYKSEIKGILNGLEFDENSFDKPSNLLSGGERTRLLLGKILLEKPDLILLDEPTNYLDIKSVEWLENYIINLKSAVLVVSHDRYFINRVATRVMEISNGGILNFEGNYDEFMQKKESVMEGRIKAYENQRREIEHQLEVIRKLKSFNREKSIKRAESREKMLDKMEIIDKPIEENNEMKLFLTPDIESGNDVLHCENLTKSYKDKTLFENISFDIKKGEHVAIIGPNGCGKTTILKLLNNIIENDSDCIIKFGSNVTIGYFDQQSTVIDDNKTIFDEISDSYPNMTQTEIRNTLSSFLFTDDEVFKKIKVLSGGEKCRVVLAKIMLSKANFLILDEPTNHLDMTGKEILEEAIRGYTGTCLYVSHDRYFINKTADRILSLNNHQITNYIGNYDYYLEKCSILEKPESNESSKETVSSEAKLDWASKKELQAQKRKIENNIKKIETEIEKYEKELERINKEMSNPSNQTNSYKLNKLYSEHEEKSTALDKLYEEWEEASSQL